MAKMPCVLCGNELEQRSAKNGKPYFVCDPCGTQFFVRGKQGIAKLQQLMHTLKKKRVAFHEHTDALFEIRAILEELNGLEDEMKKLDSSIGIFSKTNKEKSRARTLLKKRMQTLLKRLEQIAG